MKRLFFEKTGSYEIELNGLRLGGIIIGVLLILAGGTFALQGAGMLGTGSFMDSNPTWIYIGAFFFLVGLVLAIYAIFPKKKEKRQVGTSSKLDSSTQL